jgi:hypothetical protein
MDKETGTWYDTSWNVYSNKDLKFTPQFTIAFRFLIICKGIIGLNSFIMSPFEIWLLCGLESLE